MLARVQEAKRQGKPLPQNINDMERTVGGMPNAAVDAMCAMQPRLCCPHLDSAFVNLSGRELQHDSCMHAGTWRNFKQQQAPERPQVLQQDGRTPHRVPPSSGMCWA
jgi:hypothetical protein